MFPFQRYRSSTSPSRVSAPRPRPTSNRSRRPWHHAPFLWLLCLSCVSTCLLPSFAAIAQSQEQQPIQAQIVVQASPTPPTASPTPEASPQAETSPTPTVSPTTEASPTPKAAPGSTPATPASTAPSRQPTGRYVWEFRRAPETGNRLRLEGAYAETRVNFTRPRDWQVRSAQVLLRFQHSPTLLADRSNLTVRINDTGIGSVQLSSGSAQVGEMVFNVPPNLLQEENDLSILAEQNTTDTCANPSNPALWTEILPDSRVTFEYAPQPVALDFATYPFPIIDNLSLDPNQIAYARPRNFSPEWLTAVSRFQTAAARLADAKPIETRLIDGLDKLQANERLVVIGTPAEQPILANLTLPFTLRNNRFVDGKKAVFPDDVGILMMTTPPDSRTPILIATGNSAAGVAKAVQLLSQSGRKLGTGRALAVTSVEDVPTPPNRVWPGYMPLENNFKLDALNTTDDKPFEDTTVRGTNAPPVHIAFRALPDDRLLEGSFMTVRYSHSPQVDSRTSSIEVRLDGRTIGSKRLNSGGGDRESYTLRLPQDRIRPNSQLDIHFVMRPQAASECGLEADQQLWGTVHADTSFDLKRDNVVEVPNLNLLQAGYPFTDPQDLSSMAIVLPQNPNEPEVETLLDLSERMGRISQADSVKTQVFLGTVPEDMRSEKNVIGIGTRDRLPTPEVFQGKQSFDLGNSFRQVNQTQVQPIQDNQGVVKAVISPWNKERQLLALTAENEQGLREVRNLLEIDQLFGRMTGDTILVSRNKPNPDPFDPEGYTVQSFQQSDQRQIAKTDTLGFLVLFLQKNWFMIPAGIALIALPLYGFSQLYLNRVDQ